MKTLRETVVATLVLLAWLGVVRMADADLRSRDNAPVAARNAT